VHKLRAERNPWPLGKRVAFAIRDDDINYFTQPWMLDTLYGEAWKLGFKVSLAVTPYVKATKLRLIPYSLRGANDFFPISENRELVDYLLKKIADGYVDIVQHGYTHARENGKPEFAINNFKLLDERLKKGNELLRKAFKRDITVFAAPHERISRAAWRSLSQNKMCLCRTFALGRFLMTAPLSNLNLRRLVKTIVRCPNPFKSISSSIIDLTDVLVIQWDAFLSGVGIEDQLENAKERFLERLSKGEAFVVAHHYWKYFYGLELENVRHERIACFNEFLRFVSSKNEVWKTTLSELCSWIKTQRIYS